MIILQLNNSAAKTPTYTPENKIATFKCVQLCRDCNIEGCPDFPLLGSLLVLIAQLDFALYPQQCTKLFCTLLSSIFSTAYLLSVSLTVTCFVLCFLSSINSTYGTEGQNALQIICRGNIKCLVSLAKWLIFY